MTESVCVFRTWVSVCFWLEPVSVLINWVCMCVDVLSLCVLCVNDQASGMCFANSDTLPSQTSQLFTATFGVNVSLSVLLSVCLSVCLLACLSGCLSACLAQPWAGESGKQFLNKFLSTFVLLMPQTWIQISVFCATNYKPWVHLFAFVLDLHEGQQQQGVLQYNFDNSYQSLRIFQ